MTQHTTTQQTFEPSLETTDQSNCIAESPIPTYSTLIYGGIVALILLFTSIYSAIKVRKQLKDNKIVIRSKENILKLWFLLINSKKKMLFADSDSFI